MALGDFLLAFNPAEIIKGYESGQAAQRAEEAALLKEQEQALANQLKSALVMEQTSPQFAETRRLRDALTGLQATTGLQLGNIDLAAILAQTPTIQAGVEAGMTGRAAQQQRLSADEMFKRDVTSPIAREMEGAQAAQDQAMKQKLLEQRAGRVDLIGGQQTLTAQSQAAQAAANAEAAAMRNATQIVQQNYDANRSSLENLMGAYQKAPEGSRERLVIGQLVEQQNRIDLGNVQNVQGLNDWMARSGKGATAVQNADGSVVVTVPGVDAQGKPTTQTYPFRTLDEAKIQLGGYRPPAQKPATTTAPPKPVPGAGGAAAGAAAMSGARPATTPAPAPAATPTAATPAGAPAPQQLAAQIQTAAAASGVPPQQYLVELLRSLLGPTQFTAAAGVQPQPRSNVATGTITPAGARPLPQQIPQ